MWLEIIFKKVGIRMNTICSPFVADMCLFCYERNFMLSISDNNQADSIEAFNPSSIYLDDMLNLTIRISNKW